MGSERWSLVARRRDLQDLAIAVIVAALFVLSPFVPSRTLVEITAFVAIAGAVFAYRRLFAKPKAIEGVATPLARTEAAGVPWTSLAAIAAFALLYQPVFSWMYSRWTASVWLNMHGIFVVPLVLYLAHVVLSRDRETRPESSAWGFAFLLPAMALFLLDLSLRSYYVSALSLVLTLPGLSLLLLGKRRTLALKLPLVIACFMIPLPYAVSSVLALREITTAGVVWVLRSAGVAIFSSGTLIQLSWGPFRVTEACSGLATLYASIAVAAAFAGMTTSPARSFMIALSAIPLAIATNIARIVALVFMCKWWGNELLDTPLHAASGAATFVLVFLTLQRLAEPKGTST